MKKLIILLALALGSTSTTMAQDETNKQFKVTGDAISAYIQQLKTTSASAEYNGSDYVKFRKYYDLNVQTVLEDFQKTMTMQILPRLALFMNGNSQWNLEKQKTLYQQLYTLKLIELYRTFPNLFVDKFRDVRSNYHPDSISGKIGKRKYEIRYYFSKEARNRAMTKFDGYIHKSFYKEVQKFCKSKLCVSTALSDYVNFFELLDKSINIDQKIEVNGITAILKSLDVKVDENTGFHYFIDRLATFNYPDSYNKLPFTLE